ncbi:uncharacterized protein [Heterodontus francisci]|uniref:uncharacterized protein n=1 Tax=Heterodontus francisci TaxID=7792 RepID=UPI00355B7AE1
MSESKAPRFSDAAVEILVEQVRSRKEVFFPSDGRKMPRQTLRQAWDEVALNVNARTDIIRTGGQCRKKFNDITRTARDKLAHKPRKRTCIQELTQMEQEALDIIWLGSWRRMQNDSVGGRLTQGLSHYLGPAVYEMEGDQRTEKALSPAPRFQYINTGFAGGRDVQLSGCTESESFRNGEQKLAMVERRVQETDGRRASSASSSAEEHTDGEFTSPAFKMRIFQVHHQLLEALDNLSRNCLTLSERMEESVSILGDALSQDLTTLQSTKEPMVSSTDAAVMPPVQDPVVPDLASLIEAQTGAFQALTCTVSSGLERLVGYIDRGFGRVTALLQSTLPPVSAESWPHGTGTVHPVHSALSRGDIASMPVSIPQPSAATRPGSGLDQTALGTAVILQTVIKTPQTRVLRDHRL